MSDDLMNSPGYTPATEAKGSDVRAVSNNEPLEVKIIAAASDGYVNVTPEKCERIRQLIEDREKDLGGAMKRNYKRCAEAQEALWDSHCPSCNTRNVPVGKGHGCSCAPSIARVESSNRLTAAEKLSQALDACMPTIEMEWGTESDTYQAGRAALAEWETAGK